MATIGMVLESEFPPDIRVEKEASALAEAGHDVHVLALDFGARAQSVPTFREASVHRVRLPRPLHNKLHPTLLRVPLYRLAWQRWISRFIDTVSPDVLTVHDLPLAGPGLAAAGARGLPVVLDLHENFPAAIESWGFDRGPIGRFFYDLKRWRAYERRVVGEAAAVIVVVEEALARLDAFGLPADRRAVVMNTERASFGSGIAREALDAAGPIELLYLGGFGPHRGIDTAIRAMAALGGEGDAHLRIVGDGRSRDELVKLAASLDLGERVSFVRWIPADRVPGEIARCHVGLVPHARSAHTETTIPHKLFQYMSLGRPVLVSDCAPLARIVRETGAGVVFTSGDPEDMARGISEFMDPARRRDLGARGEVAARGPLAWERTAETMLHLYARVIETSARRGPVR